MFFFREFMINMLNLPYEDKIHVVFHGIEFYIKVEQGLLDLAEL